MGIIMALLAGALFGWGLIYSGMSDPYKVQNFLDLTGQWDATLAFVMGGAVAVTVPAFALLRKLAKPLFAAHFSWPNSSIIDRKLVIGAMLFGIGWGLSGLCPGPALVNIGTGQGDVLFFCAMLLAGMWIHDRLMANR
ncbi:hypothetical protein DFR26_0175 [Paraperlucidibaca baekdonensis]|uniref:Sulphur transport domain-containing protein n=1 Tax=Paraperlucidibaca baekdonensis TaxID=748120 RepID=A0A3E0H8C5_9GAMM|nr:YeeE/YedE family protein [Paraperlucidibaca baekdonensis]REH39979.1 hypothetical protein DFR26_0175 [Paraperlucidibaca baekdonensis]